jgi:hypothetical protein
MRPTKPITDSQCRAISSLTGAFLPIPRGVTRWDITSAVKFGYVEGKARKTDEGVVMHYRLTAVGKRMKDKIDQGGVDIVTPRSTLIGRAAQQAKQQPQRLAA